MNLQEVVLQLVQLPALQGIVVAGVTQLVKRAPVGPSGGPGVRLVAALLSLGAVVASAAAQGQLEQLDAQQVGQHVLEAGSAFLAAVGAWQVASQPKA